MPHPQRPPGSEARRQGRPFAWNADRAAPPSPSGMPMRSAWTTKVTSPEVKRYGCATSRRNVRQETAPPPKRGLRTAGRALDGGRRRACTARRCCAGQGLARRLAATGMCHRGGVALGRAQTGAGDGCALPGAISPGWVQNGDGRAIAARWRRRRPGLDGAGRRAAIPALWRSAGTSHPVPCSGLARAPRTSPCRRPFQERCCRLTPGRSDLRRQAS